MVVLFDKLIGVSKYCIKGLSLLSVILWEILYRAVVMRSFCFEEEFHPSGWECLKVILHCKGISQLAVVSKAIITS